jgi:hypothetical protein
MRASDGKEILFVADPGAAPPHERYRYARPDDLADRGGTWREEVLGYNNTMRSANPFGLRCAYELYENPAYARLVDHFGLENAYVLSAGWGLISANFLTPNYDVTFSSSADAHKRRRNTDRYSDLCMLPRDTGRAVVFFGGKDYIPLFCRLTESSRDERIIFYNSDRIPDAPGCTLRRFATRARTNWHYECANAFERQHSNPVNEWF